MIVVVNRHDEEASSLCRGISMPFCQDGIQPLAIFDTTENKILTPACVHTRGRIRVDGWECATEALSLRALALSDKGSLPHVAREV